MTNPTPVESQPERLACRLERLQANWSASLSEDEYGALTEAVAALSPLPVQETRDEERERVLEEAEEFGRFWIDRAQKYRRALERIRDMPIHDQDDPHRVRYVASLALAGDAAPPVQEGRREEPKAWLWEYRDPTSEYAPYKSTLLRPDEETIGNPVWRITPLYAASPAATPPSQHEGSEQEREDAEVIAEIKRDISHPEYRRGYAEGHADGIAHAEGERYEGSEQERERLMRERDEARALVVEANNSLYGSQGYFHSLNGGEFNKYHLAEGIEDLKTRLREALAALRSSPVGEREPDSAGIDQMTESIDRVSKSTSDVEQLAAWLYEEYGPGHKWDQAGDRERESWREDAVRCLGVMTKSSELGQSISSAVTASHDAGSASSEAPKRQESGAGYKYAPEHPIHTFTCGCRYKMREEGAKGCPTHGEPPGPPCASTRPALSERHLRLAETSVRNAVNNMSTADHDASDRVYHWRDGWHFQRVDVDVEVHTPHGETLVIPANEWASIVTHVSAADPSEHARAYNLALAMQMMAFTSGLAALRSSPAGEREQMAARLEQIARRNDARFDEGRSAVLLSGETELLRDAATVLYSAPPLYCATCGRTNSVAGVCFQCNPVKTRCARCGGDSLEHRPLCADCAVDHG